MVYRAFPPPAPPSGLAQCQAESPAVGQTHGVTHIHVPRAPNRVGLVPAPQLRPYPIQTPDHQRRQHQLDDAHDHTHNRVAVALFLRLRCHGFDCTARGAPWQAESNGSDGYPRRLSIKADPTPPMLAQEPQRQGGTIAGASITAFGSGP